MAVQAGREEQFEEEARVLNDDTTELGIIVSDIFKDAAAALFDRNPQISQHAMQAEQWSKQMASQVRQRSLSLLHRYMPTGDTLRRVVELQQFASEYVRMAEHARAIAEHALALGGSAELALAHIEQGDTLLRQLMYEAYVEVRDSLIVCASRDMATARRMLEANADLTQTYLTFKTLLDQAIRRDPQHALPLHRLLFIAARLHEISARTVAISNAVLFTSPQMNHDL
ncbi:MAG: PhoU domain-containing protein [Ktedonobacterales bacterium]